MNVVDSSGWLEYFAEGENADIFAPIIEETSTLIVPVICMHEIFKKIFQNYGQAAAEFRIADLVKGTVVDLDVSLSISAAILSADLKLPMADSIILAISREHNATLWTQDEHFQGLDDVRFIPKQK